MQLDKQERKHASHQQLTEKSNINVGAGSGLIAEMFTIPRKMVRRNTRVSSGCCGQGLQKLNAILP